MSSNQLFFLVNSYEFTSATGALEHHTLRIRRHARVHLGEEQAQDTLSIFPVEIVQIDLL